MLTRPRGLSSMNGRGSLLQSEFTMSLITVMYPSSLTTSLNNSLILEQVSLPATLSLNFFRAFSD